MPDEPTLHALVMHGRTMGVRYVVACVCGKFIAIKAGKPGGECECGLKYAVSTRLTTELVNRAILSEQNERRAHDAERNEKGRGTGRASTRKRR